MTDIFNGVSVGEGGVGALILGVLGWLGKQYLDSRKDKREDKQQERSTESGIVETTTDVLATVRTELERLSKAREMDAEKIESLKDKVEELDTENYRLKRRVEELENGSGGWQARNPSGLAYGEPGWVPRDAEWRGPRHPGPGEVGRGSGEGGGRAGRRRRDPGPEDRAGG